MITAIANQKEGVAKTTSTVPFIVPGRPVDLAFDADVVVKQSVQDALRVLGHLIHRAKGIVQIVTWDLEKGKGCDDFIVAHGVEAFELVMQDAIPYSEWLKKLEQQFSVAERTTNRGKSSEAVTKCHATAKTFVETAFQQKICRIS